MTELPARAQLALLVRSLVQHLPAQLGSLLEAPHFADGLGALRRLADAARLEDALRGLSPGDAQWLADTLRARWERIGSVVLEPEVALCAPDELWVGSEPVRCVVSLVAHGLDPGFEAVWEGPLLPGAPSASATLLARPPEGSEPALVRVRAHVRATVGGERRILVARASITLRRPSVVVDEARRRFIVKDHTGRPGAGVRLEVGEAAHVTGEAGLVELDAPAPPGVLLRVEGIAAGRVPAARP
jgi:hypothetical protein